MEHLWKVVFLIVLFVFVPRWLWSQETKTKLALLKYKGGGDWYANPTSLPNLIRFCNDKLGTDLAKEPATVEPGSRDIFNYPYVHMTGHGNVVFTEVEAHNLREYLLGGGFLHADDNYGLAQAFRRLPKIHEHDAKRPQALGIVKEGRLVVLFTLETDLGDGWEDPEVHNDPENRRQEALRMGANIISYVFSN